MRGEVSRPRIRPSGSGLVHFAGPKAGIGTDAYPAPKVHADRTPWCMTNAEMVHRFR